MGNNLELNIEDLQNEVSHLLQTLEELKNSDTYSNINDKEYRLLFEHLSSGFSYHEIIFDSNNTPIDCRYIEVNKAFEEILGFKREDVVGKTFLEIQSGTVEDFWMNIYGKVSKTGKTERFEQYSQLLDKYLEVIAYSPQHGKFVTIFNDITHKKIYEKKLQRQALINRTLANISKELLSSTLSIESIANYILENSCNITDSNYGFIALIDKNQNHTIYSFQNIDNSIEFQTNVLIQPIEKTESGVCNNYLYNLESTVNNKENKLHLDCKADKIDLTVRNIIAVPIFIEDELIGQIILANSTKDYINEDIENIQQISDIFSLALYRIQFENILREAKIRAEESDKLKTTFLENMSHEIRTPMNGIVGFAELLKDDDLQAEQKTEYISYINNSCNVLTKIIDDIIDISKIEAGQLQIVKKTFSLTSLLNELHKQFSDEKHKYKKSNIEIIFKPSNNNNIIVDTDQLRLSQIFFNLLSNALKFTNKGFIEFGYQVSENNAITFYVKDTGIGIPEEKQKIIFQRFRQVDESQHRNYSGAGLGLAICKNLVELLGGKIWFESIVKEGTTFFFEIPDIIKDLKGPVHFQAPKIDIPNWNNKKILVVEDDNINFILMKEILSKTNAEIIRAVNGKNAIEISASEKLDLILMDILLPDISGFDAFIEIRKTNPEIPVVAQTAQAMVEEKRKIEKAGFSAYISKPIKTGVLFKTINNFLGKFVD